MTRFVVVAGTRPEIIKVSPIIRAAISRGIELFFVHTGQHYDFELSHQMILDLELPKPNLRFKLRFDSPAAQVAEIMTRLEPIFAGRKDKDVVIVQGDTNSVLSASLTAVKCGVPLAHVEAGLRSHDWRMPEEHNRRMVDHISNYLFAPTKVSKQNLIEEHVYGRVYVTGNTVIDAVNQHINLAKKRSKVLESIPFEEYSLVTIHRSENVDNRHSLSAIINGLLKSKCPIVIPLHPRTRKMLMTFSLYGRLASSKSIILMPPQGYLEFLALMKNSRLIITDSGGIQEEATSPSICKPVLILRRSTERQEAVISKFARLVKISANEIALAVRNPDKFLIKSKRSPYGDGRSANRIVSILNKLLP